MEVAKNMDSVFANAADADVEFDTMFDQEDSLIDTVNGVNEAGEPLTGVDFVDLHQDQEDATVKDIRDYDAPDSPMGVKGAEGTKDPITDDCSVKGETDKDSEADKYYGDQECKYQCDKEKEPKVDEDSVTDTIEDVIEAACGTKDCKESADEEDDVEDWDDDDDDFEESVSIDSLEDEIQKQTNSVKLADLTIDKEDENDREPLKEGKSEDDSESSTDDIEKEIEESAGMDSDIEDVDNSDVDEEDDIIDSAVGRTRKSTKYSYETSDEDLIDMAINGETF